MPPNESEHLRAIKNQLHERKRAIEAKYRDEMRRLQAELRKVEEYAKVLGDLESELPAILAGTDMPDADTPATGRIPIGELIDRYFAETGADACTAATIKQYIAAQGYETTGATYNGIHENLRKRVERGEMEKVDGKFKPKGQGQ